MGQSWMDPGLKKLSIKDILETTGTIFIWINNI